ncbi:hypothetical protein Sgly_2109 [Syntrophobotulus glycolicus DSM 8271]|uniref:Lipopolysaccharide assembly protein A domain-containing protein n=1 Tax=Syntrophobotulus glycolicus (strain DSM 8271 / FlGlyR) TaxID=645991 RepID=F0T256_SYNGF|nr:LapA family protein [Syntrophobotulus glycolicus]ADY56400.1 hypothetical protein Sgly_2109 [Syntrophobotulus glycolicus DSM 8271]
MIILLISIMITLVIVTFAVQNAAAVTVQFFLWTTNVPLVLIIIGSFFLGALIMFLLSITKDLRNKIQHNPIKIKESKNPADTRQNTPVQEERNNHKPDQAGPNQDGQIDKDKNDSEQNKNKS